ncbi:response regulator transcription factor [Bacillus atrophaeus]|uniref:response regulator transcription factor n=1 Tax=Bacillus atrophaeus TaxID=1452 RepID=UPI0022805062|nr:response regulator transcription factor [Bacillus atrophaeus]MCY9160066.1 response regulator transcription factor [Bacillus atrophaeus]
MKIFLLESHIMILDALKQLLSLQGGIEIVGSDTDGEQAIEKICLTQPEIVLSEINLAGINGIKLAKAIRKEKLTCKIVLISSNFPYNFYQEASKLKIDGYLLKNITIDKLVFSLKAIYGGNKIFSPEVKRNSQLFTTSLTSREIDVIKLLQAGKNTKEIANTLYLSDRTIRNYIYLIKNKLNVKTRIDIINQAAKLGVI